MTRLWREWERRSKNAGARPVERICRPALGMKGAGSIGGRRRPKARPDGEGVTEWCLMVTLI